MICLGIDSSGKSAGVAIQRDGKLLYEAYLQAGLTHSETLLPLVHSALSSLALAPTDIGLIGVNSGPGSFTGLRIGLAMVKGLCFAHHTPAVGVSTLESLAHTIEGDGSILCALDARRGEVYYALFARIKGVLTRLSPDSSAVAASLTELICSADKPIHLIGDGAILCYEALACHDNIILLSENARYGRAHGVCIAAVNAYANGKSGDANELVPSYHRLSQAQRELQEREHAHDK